MVDAATRGLAGVELTNPRQQMPRLFDESRTAERADDAVVGVERHHAADFAVEMP